MNIGDTVIIGGRTMLRPGVSLVGLKGVVMPTAPNVPHGCTTLLIDWESQGYEPSDDLPNFVTIPTAHLELDATDVAVDIDLPQLKPNVNRSRPALGLVRDDAEDQVKNDASEMQRKEPAPSLVDKSGVEAPSNETEDDKSESDERPRLRLL